MDTNHGQTADMHPPEPTGTALLPQCPDHPEGGSTPGVGYAGGGFGAYRRCRQCDTVFAKVSWKDGNDPR